MRELLAWRVFGTFTADPGSHGETIERTIRYIRVGYIHCSAQLARTPFISPDRLRIPNTPRCVSRTHRCVRNTPIMKVVDADYYWDTRLPYLAIPAALPPSPPHPYLRDKSTNSQYVQFTLTKEEHKSKKEGSANPLRGHAHGRNDAT